MGFGFDLSNVVAQKDDSKKKHGDYTCQQCKLYTKCKTPKVQVEGEGKKGILIIGDSVSLAYENSRGKEHGTLYNFLRRRLQKLDINIKEDCWYIPAIRCYSTDKLSRITAKACHSLLIKDIAKLKPTTIITTSKDAWDILLYDRIGGRAGVVPYFKWCGETIPDQKLKAWVLPIYDTSMVMKDYREGQDKKYPTYYYEPYYTEQLENILDFIHKPVEVIDYDSMVKVCPTREKAIEAIKEINTWKAFAFDYETTGLRALRKEMKLHSVSFSNGVISYSMMVYEDEPFLDELRKLLTNQAIKVAHNAQFEYSWTHEKLDVIPTNLKHDPMLMEHCLHNQKPTSLKFLTYARFGVLGYDESADQYLKPSNEDSKKYGANALNTIFKAPRKDILHYCGLDSLFTYKLSKMLLDELDPVHQRPGYNLFIEGSLALADAHLNGFRIDMKAIERVEPYVIENTNKNYMKVMNSDIVKYRWRGGKFSPSSDAHVRKLLYDILGMEPVEFTDKGAPSVDEESLITYKDDVPFIMDLLEYRRWNKVQSTFIAQLKREQWDGWLRPYFGLNSVASFRGNCRNINLQNQPKRDKEMLGVVRSMFFPHKGQRLVEYDYAQLEVRGNASITQDPSLIKYVEREDTDMHLDFATVLWLMNREEVKSALRQLTKTQVFAEFYGSYYVLIAKATWKVITSPNAPKELGMDIKEHLRKQGIRTYAEWEKQCEKAEKWMWSEQFPVYQEWRKETFATFKEDGYIDYPNGFRYYGPASRNACLNAPGQGASFHINVWAFTQINYELRKKQMKSKFIGQIHDSQLYSAEPGEEETLDHLVWYYSTQAVRDYYDWIVVPLAVDKSIGPVDGSWAEVEEVGVLSF